MTEVFFESEQSIISDTTETEKLIQKSIEGALEYMDFDADAQISVTLVDNERIHDLNREYRNVDRPTDVLSFPMYTFADGDEPPEGVPVMLGDIVISVERAEEQAKEYGHSLRREMSFLTVHSVLHLLGYDHELSPEAEREMFALQDKIMEKLGIGRD